MVSTMPMMTASTGRFLVSGVSRALEPWDIAYSDSSNDIQMLKCARDPVLVNADAETVRRVERALGREARKVDWF